MMTCVSAHSAPPPVLHMDAATFFGNGVLATRLNDFIEEQLDDAAAIATLTDGDLSNVNGTPLSESELVRPSATRTKLARIRPPAAQLGRSTTRVFPPVRRCASALRLHTPATCVWCTSRPHARTRATRLPAPACVFEARAPRPSARVAGGVPSAGAAVFCEAATHREGRFVRGHVGNADGAENASHVKLVRRGPTVALCCAPHALTLSPQGEREDALAQQPDPVAGRHQRLAPAAEPSERACGLPAGGYQGASEQLRRCGTRSSDSPLPRQLGDGDEGGHAAKAPKVREIGNAPAWRLTRPTPRSTGARRTATRRSGLATRTSSSWTGTGQPSRPPTPRQR